MKRLFTAFLAIVFAFAVAAPIQQALAAGKDEVNDGQPGAAMDNAMNDKGEGKGDMKGKKNHHHHANKEHHKGHHHHDSKKDDKKSDDSGK